MTRLGASVRIAQYVVGSSAVIAALAFGALEARAASEANGRFCPPYNPPTYLGACTSQRQCQEDCEFYNPPPVQGDCVNDGCCVCSI